MAAAPVTQELLAATMEVREQELRRSMQEHVAQVTGALADRVNAYVDTHATLHATMQGTTDMLEVRIGQVYAAQEQQQNTVALIGVEIEGIKKNMATGPPGIDNAIEARLGAIDAALREVVAEMANLKNDMINLKGSPGDLQDGLV